MRITNKQRMVPISLSFLILASSGCAEPFERQDTRIESPRFVYVAAHHETLGAGVEVNATALLYREKYAALGSTLELTWFILDPLNTDAAALSSIRARTPEDLAATEGVKILGNGPDLSFTLSDIGALVEGDSIPLGVAASWTGGTDLAYIPLTIGEAQARPADPPEGASIYRVPALDPLAQGDTLSRESLNADNRQSMESQPTSPLLFPGQVVRLETSRSEVLWRHVGRSLTLLPLDDSDVDILPGLLAVDESDDSQVFLYEADTGVVTLVGAPLSPDGGPPIIQQLAICPGGHDLTPCRDAGFNSHTIASQNGLFLDVSFEYNIDLATLLEDESPMYLRGHFVASTGEARAPWFISAHWVNPEFLPESDPYGLEKLDCSHPIPLDRPFSLEHILYGRCTLEELERQEIVIDVEFLPLPEAPE